MTLRTLARGSAIYAAGTLLARFGGFVLLPIYLALMSQSEYGLVALVTSIVGFLNILYRLGLDGALMRLHFDTGDEDRPGLYRTLLALTIAVAAALSVALGVLVGPVFDTIFFGVSFIPYGLLALALAFVGSADYVPAIRYRATQQPGRFVAFNLGSFAISSACSLALVVIGMGAAGALLGQLIGGAVMLVVAIAITVRPRGRTWLPQAIRPSLRFSLPIVPHQVSTWSIRLSDRWLLGLLLPLPAMQRLEAIGAYSVGYQLGSLVSMVSTSFNAAWTPYLYRVGDGPRGPRIFRSVLTITAAGFAWLALALAALAPEIIAVIADPGYAVAAEVMPVIAFGAACQAAYTMLVGIVFLRRQTGYLPAITGASAVANIGLNVVLIPRLGVMGAAVTTLIAYLVFAALTYAFARRIYPLDVDVRRFLLITTLTVTGALLARRFDAPAGEIWPSGAIHAGIVLAIGAILIPVVRGPFAELRHDVAIAGDGDDPPVTRASGTSAE